MPTTFDSTVQITVSPDAQPVTRQGFGTAIVVDAASMTERVLFFEDVTGASDALAAGDITQAQYDAIALGFGQSPAPARMGAGRGSFTDVAQVDTVTIGGTIADGDIFNITVNGELITYTAGSGDTASDVAAGLRTDGAGLSEPVTVGGTGADVVLTADVAGDAFTTTVSKTSAAGTITLVNTTPNQSITEELVAILDENDTWFAFSLISRAKKDILRAAAWAESNNKLFAPQTSDADAASATAGNVLATLKAASYEWTFPTWYSDDDVSASFAWLVTVLANDMDSNSTVWYDKTLEGVINDSENVTATQKSNILAQNGNLYLTLGSVGATGPGKTSAGRFIDVIVTVAWLQTRVDEDLKQLRLDYSNRNSKIPYTDEGFSVVGAKVEARLRSGQRAGHFSGGVEDVFVTLPKRSEILAATSTARRLNFKFGALLSGGVYEIIGTGSLTDSVVTYQLLSTEEV